MLGRPSKDPGRVAGRVTSVGVLIGVCCRGVRRRLTYPCRRRRPCLPAPRQHNTQSSLPHLARTSASTVTVLPMPVPHTSSVGREAEPCDYRTGRDGCSSYRRDDGAGTQLLNHQTLHCSDALIIVLAHHHHTCTAEMSPYSNRRLTGGSTPGILKGCRPVRRGRCKPNNGSSSQYIHHRHHLRRGTSRAPLSPS